MITLSWSVVFVLAALALPGIALLIEFFRAFGAGLIAGWRRRRSGKGGGV